MFEELLSEVFNWQDNANGARTVTMNKQSLLGLMLLLTSFAYGQAPQRDSPQLTALRRTIVQRMADECVTVTPRSQLLRDGTKATAERCINQSDKLLRQFSTEMMKEIKKFLDAHKAAYCGSK